MKKQIRVSIQKQINVKQLLQRIPRANQKIFKIYNPQKDQYIPINTINFYKDMYTISREYFKLDVIIIKYCQNQEYFQEISNSQQQDQIKKQRSGQRNIKQVIELVQKWRLYHDDPPDGKRKTLQEAAKLVGISKKSLDDYYYQLRIGQKHDFDFNSHLNQKIGVLRNFIKIKQPERKIQGKNAKHPKKLKIIQEFSEKLKITEGSTNTNSNVEDLIELPNKIQTEGKNSPIVGNNSLQFNHTLDYLSEDRMFFEPQSTPFFDKFLDISQNFEDDFHLIIDDPLDSYLPFIDMLTKKSNVGQDLI